MLEKNVLVSPYGFVFSTAHRDGDIDVLLNAIEAALEACAS
jgi:glutamate-1-semialdehyde aminotransferase